MAFSGLFGLHKSGAEAGLFLLVSDDSRAPPLKAILSQFFSGYYISLRLFFGGTLFFTRSFVQQKRKSTEGEKSREGGFFKVLIFPAKATQHPLPAVFIGACSLPEIMPV